MTHTQGTTYPGFRDRRHHISIPTRCGTKSVLAPFCGYFAIFPIIIHQMPSHRCILRRSTYPSESSHIAAINRTGSHCLDTASFLAFRTTSLAPLEQTPTENVFFATRFYNTHVPCPTNQRTAGKIHHCLVAEASPPTHKTERQSTQPSGWTGALVFCSPGVPNSERPHSPFFKANASSKIRGYGFSPYLKASDGQARPAFPFS